MHVFAIYGHAASTTANGMDNFHLHLTQYAFRRKDLIANFERIAATCAPVGVIYTVKKIGWAEGPFEFRVTREAN